MPGAVMVSGFVMLFVVYLMLLNVVSFFISLYSGCDVFCAFCLICDECILKFYWSCSLFVLSCMCSVIVSCMHPIAVLNASFRVVLSLFMFVEDPRGDHMDEAYSRVDRTTAL